MLSGMKSSGGMETREQSLSEAPPPARRAQPHEKEKLARGQGVEEGLFVALTILRDLAAVMVDREQAALPGATANYARRTRIKAYQVAANRIETRLTRQQRLLAKLETREDQVQAEDILKAAVEDLGL
jgi:hypothetical protein